MKKEQNWPEGPVDAGWLAEEPETIETAKISRAAAATPTATADLLFCKAAKDFSRTLLVTGKITVDGLAEITMLTRLASASAEASPDHRNADALMQALARIEAVAKRSSGYVRGMAERVGVDM